MKNLMKNNVKWMKLGPESQNGLQKVTRVHSAKPDEVRKYLLVAVAFALISCEKEDNIVDSNKMEIHSEQIGEMVMRELKKIDNIAYIRFASVYREFKDVGDFQAHIRDLKNH